MLRLGARSVPLLRSSLQNLTFNSLGSCCSRLPSMVDGLLDLYLPDTIENLISAGSPPPAVSMSYPSPRCSVEQPRMRRSTPPSCPPLPAGVSVFVSAGDNGASLCARDFTVGAQFASQSVWQRARLRNYRKHQCRRVLRIMRNNVRGRNKTACGFDFLAGIEITIETGEIAAGNFQA